MLMAMHCGAEQRGRCNRSGADVTRFSLCLEWRQRRRRMAFEHDELRARVEK